MSRRSSASVSFSKCRKSEQRRKGQEWARCLLCTEEILSVGEAREVDRVPVNL